MQILKWERECADIKVGESVQILKWERECADIKHFKLITYIRTLIT